MPLVIGACGHRDVPHRDRHALIQIAHDTLRSLMTDHVGMPLIVLSALADGADRIVARAALRLRATHPHDVRLIVPLPMHRDVYARDFHTPASLDEFWNLLDEADDWFELDLVEDNTAESIQFSSDHRDRQYQAVGEYVARHCQILLALWDGECKDTIGGTSSIVRFKLEDPSARGPVHQIVTPRAHKPEPEGALRSRDLYPRLTDWRYYQDMFDDAREYNELVTAPDERLGSEVTDSLKAGSLMPILQLLPPPLQETMIRYSAADALAVSMSRDAASVQKSIHRWAFVGLAFFEAFAHGSDILALVAKPSELAVFIGRAVSLLAVGGAFARALWLHSSRQPTLDRHQDYRALAEGLRVQFFWCLAGIDDSVGDFYLGKRVTELEWIRHALRGWCIWRPGMVDSSQTLPIVQDHWIRDQRDYFAAREGERLDERNDRWIDWLLRTAVVGGLVWLTCRLPASARLPEGIAAAHFVIPICALVVGIAVAWSAMTRSRRGASQARATGFTLHRLWRTTPSIVGGVASGILLCAIARRLSPTTWREILDVATILVVGLSLAGAGLFQHYGEKMAFKEHAKQYHDMSRLFGDSLERMDRLATDDDQQRRELIRTLGKSALEENGDWVMLHRERPLEVPLG